MGTGRRVLLLVQLLAFVPTCQHYLIGNNVAKINAEVYGDIQENASVDGKPGVSNTGDYMIPVNSTEPRNNTAHLEMNFPNGDMLKLQEDQTVLSISEFAPGINETTTESVQTPEHPTKANTPRIPNGVIFIWSLIGSMMVAGSVFFYKCRHRGFAARGFAARRQRFLQRRRHMRHLDSQRYTMQQLRAQELAHRANP